MGKHSGRSDGLAVWCKSCMSAYHREYNQRPEVKKRAAAQSLARYHLFSSDEKLRIQERRYNTARELQAKYGLTLDEYEGMLAAQGGGCAICNRPPSPKRRLPVDHDHACCPGAQTCGACVRGILCVTCNVWLGFYENHEWRAKADAYLDREIARREAEATD